MICPHCKNEKWDQSTCPHCGLSQKEAFLAAAHQAEHDGKMDLAASYYEKCLQCSYVPEINQKRVICLYMMGKSQADPSAFQKAAEGLLVAVNEDWSWQTGHQYLIDLYYKFDKLEILEKEYQRIAEQNESRKISCENLIKTIKLTRKFKQNPPKVPAAQLESSTIGAIFNSFWPLLGIPPLLYVAYELTQLASFKNGSHTDLLVFIFFILGVSICILFLLSMSKFRNKNKGKVKEIKIDESNRS